MPAWLFAVLACGAPEPSAAPPATPPAASAAADGPAHDHAAHAHDHGAHEPAAGAADHHGAHDPAAGDHHGAHMAVMAETRERLRVELGEAYAAPVAGLDGADVARGKSIYAKSCAVCHGEDGKGDGPGGAGLSPPPADLTDAFHARYYSDAGRIAIIRHGLPGTGMAGFDAILSSQDVLDVYAHVRTLR